MTTLKVSNMTTLYAVMKNTDLTEGRGMQYPWVVTRLYSTAKRFANKGYVMGSNCPIEKFETKMIDGYEYVPLIYTPIAMDKEEDKLAEVKYKARIAAIDKALASGLTWKDLGALGYVED